MFSKDDFFIYIFIDQIFIQGKTLQKILYTNKIKIMLSMCALYTSNLKLEKMVNKCYHGVIER